MSACVVDRSMGSHAYYWLNNCKTSLLLGEGLVLQTISSKTLTDAKLSTFIRFLLFYSCRFLSSVVLSRNESFCVSFKPEEF